MNNRNETGSVQQIGQASSLGVQHVNMLHQGSFIRARLAEGCGANHVLLAIVVATFCIYDACGQGVPQDYLILLAVERVMYTDLYYPSQSCRYYTGGRERKARTTTGFVLRIKTHTLILLIL
jgi:hypothetical protein